MSTFALSSRKRLFDNVRYVALGGGAIYGVMYIGALMELCRHDKRVYSTWVSTLRAVAGTSAGTLVGVMLAAGMDPWEMQEVTERAGFSCVVEGILDIGIRHVNRACAVTSGVKVDAAIQNLIKQITGRAETTFLQFYARTRRKFVVAVTNAQTCMAEFWSYENQPNLEIWRAIRCSVCVPGLFPPHIVDGKSFFDGGVTCNLACHLFPPSQTLSLFVHPQFSQPKETKLLTVLSHNLMMYMASAQLGPMRTSHKLAFRAVPCVVTQADTGFLGAFAFNADHKTLNDLVQDGARSVRAVLARDAIVCAMIVLLTCYIKTKLSA